MGRENYCRMATVPQRVKYDQPSTIDNKYRPKILHRKISVLMMNERHSCIFIDFKSVL